ncbi:MAG: hydantoinase/oxoprolinase family protein [bacterium]|nr:hydantoinase/oxoprolinase family protein [bacterium]
MRVGVDIGGTFTDIVMSDNGQLTIHKLPTTPQDPSLAMLEGINTITQNAIDQLEWVAHGTTVATNAILERKGGVVALITTQGFRDILFIGRQNRPDLYALTPTLPAPLIPRDLCYDVAERLDYTGKVLKALDNASLNDIIDDLAKRKVDAVAVCLLYSYLNPDHERLIAEKIIQRGVLARHQIVLSHDVLPEFREYERASTTALEAYVRPTVRRYIENLRNKLHAPLRVMKSDGGLMSAERIGTQTIQTALSGPAAGVIGAYKIAQLAGIEGIITLDIGGTSTDVALCAPIPLSRPQSVIDGLPLRTRLLDIETIGAGGGSIARVDAGGVMRVGPQSAGSMPGPAVYGRGGIGATVSDALAVLGYLDPAHFLGGNMPLHPQLAEKVINNLAKELHKSVIETAEGIIEIANSNIERALRRVSVARGYDPRDFTLVAFGGGGALQACAVASRLQIPRVLIPQHPGVLCALGLLMADISLNYSQAVMTRLDLPQADSALRTALMMCYDTAQSDLSAEGIPDQDRVYIPSLDMRYVGQAHELNIPYDQNSDLAQAFYQAHQKAYGHALYDRPIEVVTARLKAVGMVTHPHIKPEAISQNPSPDIALLGAKVTVRGENLRLYERGKLPVGAEINGSALIFQLDSTVYIPTGWRAKCDTFRNLILEPQ